MSDVPAASPMAADIARQPATIEAFADRAARFQALGRSALTPGAGGRIWVAGCGDGVFAAAAAAGFAARLGLDWRPVGALDLVLAPERLKPADSVVAISMSGNVDRTVEAARAVAARGVRLIALVNGGGGKLGEIAGAKLSLDLADVAPFLCGTASYTLTVAALMALAAGAADAGLPDYAMIAAAQHAALAAGAAVVETIAPPTGVRLLSAGSDLGTVQYGAAKLVELTRIPAWSADLEEFAHSQYWAMPVGDLVTVVAGEPGLAAYAAESCKALAELGVATLAIDAAGAPVATARHRATLPAMPAEFFALAAALPLQLLAARMARATGLDPDTRAHLKGDTLRFRVSRMLTRRSLIGTGA